MISITWFCVFGSFCAASAEENSVGLERVNKALRTALASINAEQENSVGAYLGWGGRMGVEWNSEDIWFCGSDKCGKFTSHNKAWTELSPDKDKEDLRFCPKNTYHNRFVDSHSVADGVNNLNPLSWSLSTQYLRQCGYAAMRQIEDQLPPQDCKPGKYEGYRKLNIGRMGEEECRRLTEGTYAWNYGLGNCLWYYGYRFPADWTTNPSEDRNGDWITCVRSGYLFETKTSGQCDEIVTEQKCRDLTAFFHKQVTRFNSFQSSSAPKGCYVYTVPGKYEHEVYYNANGNQPCTWDRQCICVQSHDHIG